MPEILEVEMFRRASEAVVGRRITAVLANDPIVVPEPAPLRALVGATVVDVVRQGKLMGIVVSASRQRSTIDVHFGMSGRVIVDGRSPIEELAYGASDDARWHRFGLGFGRRWLIVSDPRRFARIGRDADRSTLGPDAWTVGKREFVAALRGRRTAIKAALLDQSAVAGLGNMLVDEILMRAAIDPRRPVVSLDDTQLAALHPLMRRVLDQLWKRGGSHAGDLSAELRLPGAPCPIDGSALQRGRVGGRTTLWCPAHQH